MNKDETTIVYTTTRTSNGRWHLEAEETSVGGLRIWSTYIGAYSSKQEALLAARLLETRHLVEPEYPLPDRRGAVEHTRAMS